jgi:hypothetical protein
MRKEIPAHILSKLDLHYSEPCFVLHELDLGDGYFIRVIGDPDNGAYEWCVERPESAKRYGKPAIEYSDAGYGQTEIALRDGLIAYFGLPEEPTLNGTA